MVSLKMHTWFNIFSAENNEKNKKYIENTKLVFFDELVEMISFTARCAKRLSCPILLKYLDTKKKCNKIEVRTCCS